MRIGVPVTFARLNAIPALESYIDQHPKLDFDIVMDDHAIELIEQGIDVALRMGRLDDPGTTARRVSSARRLVVGTREYFARAVRNRSLSYCQDPALGVRRAISISREPRR